MDKKKELDNLFNEWKEEQMKDNSDTIESPIVFKRIAKDSFSYDGFVYDDNECTVLYILAESNLQESVKIDNNEFWFKDVYQSKKNQTAIPRRTEKLQKLLYNNIDGIGLQDISYMNINKRGGYSPCNWEALKKYYFKYRDFIWKEINIIKPKIIVFCAGKNSIDIYNDLVENKDKIGCSSILFMHHPSCRCTEEKYIEDFKDQIKNNNFDNGGL